MDEIGKNAIIIYGDDKGIIGKIIDIYSGWNYGLYTIIDSEGKEYVVYHDEIKVLE